MSGHTAVLHIWKAASTWAIGKLAGHASWTCPTADVMSA